MWRLLFDAAPQSTFLLSASRSLPSAEGRLIQLRGLPMKEAMDLAGRIMGRQFDEAERAAVREICTALQGHPLRIIQTIARAKEENLSLAQVARTLKAGEADERRRWGLLALPEKSRRALAALAALNGAPINSQHLLSLAGVDENGSAIEDLLRRGLLQREDQELRLSGDLGEVLRQIWDLSPWGERLVDHFLDWAAIHGGVAQEVAAQVEALQAAIDWAGELERWRDLAAPGALAGGGAGIELALGRLGADAAVGLNGRPPGRRSARPGLGAAPTWQPVPRPGRSVRRPPGVGQRAALARSHGRCNRGGFHPPQPENAARRPAFRQASGEATAETSHGRRRISGIAAALRDVFARPRQRAAAWLGSGIPGRGGVGQCHGSRYFAADVHVEPDRVANAQPHAHGDGIRQRLPPRTRRRRPRRFAGALGNADPNRYGDLDADFTFTPTDRPTLTDTPRPTDTPTSTLTPTPTDTPTPTPTLTPTDPAPDPPVDLFVRDSCSDGLYYVALVWVDQSEDEEGYLVFRDGQVIAELEPNADFYDEKLKQSGRYTYGVQAYNQWGESEMVEAVSKGCSSFEDILPTIIPVFPIDPIWPIAPTVPSIP